MVALVPLGDLTRFRRSDIKSEAYLVTEDVCIKSHGILLAARSAKLEKMVEESENIPPVECSDNITVLEDCLELVYGGSVDIREENCKSIYKFGNLFQIREMMDGVLSWIAVHVTYDKFWKVYFELKNLHDDTSVFADILKGYFSADGGNFIKHTAELCRFVSVSLYLSFSLFSLSLSLLSLSLSLSLFSLCISLSLSLCLSLSLSLSSLSLSVSLSLSLSLSLSNSFILHHYTLCVI